MANPEDSASIPADANANPNPNADPDPLQLVRRAWQDVLGTDEVPLDTGFFEAGGNSMLLVMLSDELSDQTGRELEVAELFRHDTVRAQARLLDPSYEPAAPAPAAAAPAGRGRLLGSARRGRTDTVPATGPQQPEGSAAR
ncbi:acyl carrier protein [Streptomyces monomycini]|uniref:acyl carrier protein n=1 Tax=Streptomyces monomycini TaxID=371720 RepID=UPI0007C4B740|nr:acyl carrier protein [Streptomyces monomycini]